MCGWVEESLDYDHAEEEELRGGLPFWGRVLQSLNYQVKGGWLSLPFPLAAQVKVVLSSVKHLLPSKAV